MKLYSYSGIDGRGSIECTLRGLKYGDMVSVRKRLSVPLNVFVEMITFVFFSKLSGKRLWGGGGQMGEK